MKHAVANGLNMIEAVASNPNAFSKVIDEDLVRRVIKILNDNISDPSITLSCLRVLEKIGKTDKGLAMILENDGIGSLLTLLSSVSKSEFHGPEDAEAVMRGTRILGKMAKHDGAITLIKEAGGIDTYLSVLDSFPHNNKIARLGGKFLSQITGDSIEELVNLLRDKGDSSSALLERTLALLASLAIDNGSSEDIIKSGGVAAILAQLEQEITGKALESTCRAISRLAHNARNIQGLVDDGAIKQLAASLNSKQATEESKAQAIDALRKIGSHPAFAQALIDSGAVTAVVNTLINESSSLTVASACIHFLSVMQQHDDFDMQSIPDMKGSIDAVVKVMLQNPDVELVQEHGTISLCGFCAATDTENLGAIIDAEAVPIVIKNIVDHPENMDLLKHSMTLLTHMLLVKEGEVAVRNGGGIDAIVSAVMFHSDNDEVRKAAMDVVELLSSDELVQQTIHGLRRFLEGSMDESEFTRVPVMAMCLGTLAIIPENVKRIVKYDGVPPMVDLLGMVADIPECVAQEEILSALCRSIKEVIGNSAAVEEVVDPTKIVAAAISILQSHPHLELAVAQALSLIVGITKMCPDLDYGQFPIIESCFTVIKNNPTDPSVVDPASALILFLAKLLGGEVTNSKSGGRAAVIVVANNAAGDESLLAALTNSLLTMEIVSECREGKEALLKQGAVSAVFAAMEKQGSNAAFISACRRAISNLVDADSVYETLGELSQFTAEDISAAKPAIAKCVERLGLLLLCGDFSDVIASSNGIELLVNIMTGAQHIESKTERQALTLALITAFGRAAGNANVESALPIVPMIVKVMQENASIEALQSVTALTRDDSVLKELVTYGAVEALLPLIRDGEMDPEMTQWASVALSGLAKDADGAQRIVKGGGVHYLCEYISENEGVNVIESIRLLQNLANHADTLTVINGGVLDAVADVLFLLFGKDDTSGLIATMDLISKIASDNEGASAVLRKDIPASVISVINSNEVYIKSSSCMAAFSEMVNTLGNADGIADAADHLRTIGAPEILIKAMNVNATSTEMVKACAVALGTIKGGGADGLKTIMDQVVTCIEVMEGGDDEIIENFTRGMQLCSNLMLGEGAVDQELANKMMEILNRAVVALRNFEASPAQQDAMSICLSTMSRLAAIDAVKIDVNSAVSMCQGEFAGSNLVIESACACLRSIAVVEGGIHAIVSHGMVAKIQNAAHGKGQIGRIGASGMALQAAKAMEVIAEQALSHAVKLIGTDGGATAIAAILKDIEDKKSMQVTLDQICQAQGGLEALIDTLVAMGPPDFGGEGAIVSAVVKAILKQRDENQKIAVVSSTAQLNALASAQKINPDAVILMESAGESIDGQQLIVGSELCIEVLLESLMASNSIASEMAASIFSKCIASNDPKIMTLLRDAGLAKKLLTAMKDSKNLHDDIFSQNALYCLRSMADTLGIGGMNIQKEGMIIVQNALYQHSKNGYIQETCNALLAHMTQAFAGATEALLEDKLRNLTNVHHNSAMWHRVKSEDGSGHDYFFNNQTNESSWDQADVHLLLETELDGILTLVESLNGSFVDLDVSCAASLVAVLTTHRDDTGIFGRVLNTLSNLCASEEVTSILCSSADMTELVKAMGSYVSDAETTQKIIDIIDIMVGLDFVIESLCAFEHIQMINYVVWQQLEVEGIVHKGLKILRSLSAGNVEVIDFEMKVEAHVTMKHAISRHMESKDVTEEVFICIGNLFYGEEDNRKIVAEIATEDLLASLARWEKDHDMVEVMLKTIGNMSLDDDAIIGMINRHAVAKLVSAMNLHRDSKEIARLGVMVISNFGAINDEEKDAYATEYIIRERGTVAVKDAMKRYSDNLDIVEATMEALFNLGNEVDAAVELAEMGVMEMTISAMERFDYSENLMSWAAKFISVFTYAEETLGKFAELNGCEKLIEMMQKRLDDEPFLEDACLSLSNALVNEANREVLEHGTGITVLLQSLDLYNNNENLVKYVIGALNRLCTSDEVSAEVAKQGMHVFMKTLAIATECDSIDVLSLIFELFGQLAFLKDNIKYMVQQGAIKVLLQMMEVFMDNKELMIQTLNTLDNIISSDEEYAAILIEKGGQAKIDEVKNMHPGDQALLKQLNITITSINAMSKIKEQVGTKVNRGALFARLGRDVVTLEGEERNVGREKAPDGDPLDKYRTYLQRGFSVQVHDKGRKWEKHVFVSKDWASITIKDETSSSKIKKKISIRKIKGATGGYGPGHSGKQKRKKVRAKEERCLHLESSADDHKLALECASETERDRCLEALSTLFEVSRKWPKKVAPP